MGDIPFAIFAGTVSCDHYGSRVTFEYDGVEYELCEDCLIPRRVYRLLGVLDDGAAVLFVYKKIKDKITPEIMMKVEDTLNDWFGVEYEVIG
jgi:hypothetical protein